MLVLTDQPAENPAASYLPCREIGESGWGNLGSVRWPQVQGAVRTFLQGCKSDSIVAALRDRGFAPCTCATVVAHVVSGVALGR
jgi:hypothetical protein